jgi:hypothetical protein
MFPIKYHNEASTGTYTTQNYSASWIGSAIGYGFNVQPHLCVSNSACFASSCFGSSLTTPSDDRWQSNEFNEGYQTEMAARNCAWE